MTGSLVGIGRVDRLLIADYRKGKHAVIGCEFRFQRIDTHPNAVRVEVRMLVDVLRVVLVVWMDLAHLTQHQTARGLVSHDVAALTIGWGAFGDLES